MAAAVAADAEADEPAAAAALPLGMPLSVVSLVWHVHFVALPVVACRRGSSGQQTLGACARPAAAAQHSRRSRHASRIVFSLLYAPLKYCTRVLVPR